MSVMNLGDPVDKGFTILASCSWSWSSPSRPGSDKSELESGDMGILHEFVSIAGERFWLTWSIDGSAHLLFPNSCSRKALVSFSNSIVRRFSSDRCFFVTSILVSSPSNVYAALRRLQLSQGQPPVHLIFCRRHRRHLVSIVSKHSGRDGDGKPTHLLPAFSRDRWWFLPYGLTSTIKHDRPWVLV